MSDKPTENVTSTKPHAYRGADLRLASRPGIPRDAAPHVLPHAHWTVPEQQSLEIAAIFRPERHRETAVFGTALPPRGLTGFLRRFAHRIPDHRVSHWLLLLAADRLDVLESLPRTLATKSGRSSLLAALEPPQKR
jgi:hypothetical protein